LNETERLAPEIRDGERRRNRALHRWRKLRYDRGKWSWSKFSPFFMVASVLSFAMLKQKINYIQQLSAH
jgi:hypothetical protein